MGLNVFDHRFKSKESGFIYTPNVSYLRVMIRENEVDKIMNQVNLVIGGIIVFVFAYLVMWFWYHALPETRSPKKKRRR